MNEPRPAKFRGVVEGEILEITHVDIDCPLIGCQILITKDGKVAVTVDDKPILAIRRGGLLSVCDQRTGYYHES